MGQLTRLSPEAAMEVLLATRNRAKQDRFRWLLEGLDLRPRTPDEPPSLAEPDESGSTHREVAAQKALHYSRHTPALVIASDGGISVPALADRWESLRTRRAAGAAATDQARADYLLALAHDLVGEQRAVERIEAIALARQDQLLAAWEAARPLGRLVERYDPTHIAGGFWLPAVIYLPHLGKTFAEVTAEERETLDDPWNALRPLAQEWISSYLAPSSESEPRP